MLDYDPATGVFRWRVSNSNRVTVGSKAGCLCKRHGYIVIGVNGQVLGAHRLAWLWMTGEMPSGLVDHVNGNRQENRWDNLRLASQSDNLCNRGKQKNNTSGFKGVNRHSQSGKWEARITKNKVTKRLGLFDSAIDAANAYCRAASAVHGEFARTE